MFKVTFKNKWEENAVELEKEILDYLKIKYKLYENFRARFCVGGYEKRCGDDKEKLLRARIRCFYNFLFFYYEDILVKYTDLDLNKGVARESDLPGRTIFLTPKCRDIETGGPAIDKLYYDLKDLDFPEVEEVLEFLVLVNEYRLPSRIILKD